MALLPIVERELRVAARQPRTWWRRVLAGVVGTAILILVYFDVSRWADTSRIGRQLFEALSAFSFVFALLAGPLATSDCISSEKREGTLGLLFLTNLRSFDVVLGKLFASSLNIIFAYLAVLPLLSLPLLMGGVSSRMLVNGVLVLASTFSLSLAVGLFCSALCTSGRKSLVLVILTLLFLTIGFPILGEEFLRIRLHSNSAPYFYMLCPLYAAEVGFGSNRPAWHLWLNLSATQTLSLMLVLLSFYLTARGWKDRPPSLRRIRWSDWMTRLSAGTSAHRAAFRRRALDCNPLLWLDGRYRLRKALLWLALAVGIGLYLWGYANKRYWATRDDILGWTIAVHYAVLLWLALEAPHRFTEDRHSGAMELLLCTPLGTREMVHGRMLALRSQFGWAMVTLVVFDLVMLSNFITDHYTLWLWRPFGFASEFALACACALILFPLQAWCLARIGIYLGLRHKSSLTAGFGAVWRVVLLPWLAFGILALIYDLLRLHRFVRVSDWMAVLIWFLVQVSASLFFVSIASWRLRHNFRELAARPVKSPWWWRLLRI